MSLKLSFYDLRRPNEKRFEAIRAATIVSDHSPSQAKTETDLHNGNLFRGLKQVLEKLGPLLRRQTDARKKVGNNSECHDLRKEKKG